MKYVYLFGILAVFWLGSFVGDWEFKHLGYNHWVVIPTDITMFGFIIILGLKFYSKAWHDHFGKKEGK